ncbi:MAG: ribonuclease Z [Gemmatimonadaceae bacterium]|jgi:ribonuclease BN (tRNA processing enzyme)|nr:ribonuclease Z [Gemmatimonadaceae bacterium]
MRLTTVGTGTVAPHPTRVASGHLLQTDDVTLLLDCGPGITHRLAALRLAWPTITHVALTHFHLDHVGEVAALCYAFKYGQLPPRSAPLTLLGPPGTRDLLDRLAITYGTWLHAPGYALEVVELPREGGEVTLGTSVRLRTFPVPHTPESVAYSVEANGRRVVYSGDTGYDEPFARWAAGCDLLLLECSLPETLAIPSHLTPRQAGAMAALANPRRLVLTHFYAPVETEELAATVAAEFTGEVTLAHDGWAIDL